jgi:endonuclease/exonuclease/phosphatase family metal-dependent hydrolase
MRAMTWNLQGRIGDWQARQTAIESGLRAAAPDVAMLQESWVEPDGSTQAQLFADRLSMFTVTAASLAGFDRYPDAPYWVVNAILSRWPIEIIAATALPDEHGEPTWRHVLLARVLRPAELGGEFLVAGTHLEHGLDRTATRSAQLRSLCGHLAAASGGVDAWRLNHPIVLGGDLNAVPHSDEIRSVTGASAPFVDGFVLVDAWDACGNPERGDTWSSQNPLVPRRAIHPNRRLDYLMVSAPRRRNVGHVERCWLSGDAPIAGVWASDHFAVLAEIDL